MTGQGNTTKNHKGSTNTKQDNGNDKVNTVYLYGVKVIGFPKALDQHFTIFYPT